MEIDSQRNAGAAARAAGVTVREVSTLDEFTSVGLLLDAIWRPDPTNPPVTVELLRALAKSGNYVAGAYDGAELIGASVAFFGPPLDRAMHSHIAGVSAAAHGRSVGFALKLHQRAWAQQRGVATIDWTFDPLVRRNAYFNLVKLAAEVTEYLPDFYGGMHDGINRGDTTDRLLVRWQLDRPEVVAVAAGRRVIVDGLAEQSSGAVVALGMSDRGAPTIGPQDAFTPGSATPGSATPGSATLLVAVPPDIERLRRTDPGLSRQWRAAVREVLGALIADGARVTGFDRAGWYRLEHGHGHGNRLGEGIG